MGLLFFHRDDAGNKISMESKLTPEDLKRETKLEEHVSIFTDFLENQAGDGLYGYQGDYNVSRMLTIPKTMTDRISHAERVQRVRKRMENGHPPLLVSCDPKRGIDIMAEEDREAMEQGYICHRCRQYQAVPSAPKCNWLGNPNDGCGQINY